MSNDFYNHTSGQPAVLSRGSSAAIRAEFDLVQAGFSALPTKVQAFTNSAQYAVDTGTTNAFSVAIGSAVVAYSDGMEVVFKAANAVTGAATINVNAIGIKTITRSDGTALLANDIAVGQIVSVRYNTTTGQFQYSAVASVAAAITAHEAASNPHPQYLQAADIATKADLVAGKVPSSQLPSYVDDVIEAANAAALPVTGETGKIYVTLDDNAQHRWSGSAYVMLVASPGTTDAVTEGSTNKYFTEARVRATALTGLSTASASTITAADSVLSAIGKAQAQIAAVVSISLAATAWVETSGNDGTGTLGNPAKPFATINAALDALASTGGRIYIGRGTFAAITDDYQGTSTPDPASKLKKNVHFYGAGMPEVASDYSHLIDLTGTVIKGPLVINSVTSRNGIRLFNLGIDSGTDVCTALYGGVAQEGLLFANIAQGVLSPALGVEAHNVISLCKSATAAVHAMLFENLRDPDISNIHSYYGAHGVAIKVIGGTVNGVHSYGHSTSALYPKDDNYARCHEVTITNVVCGEIAAGDTPNAIHLTTGGTGDLEKVSISNVQLKGILTNDIIIDALSSGTTKNVRIDNIQSDSATLRTSLAGVDKNTVVVNGVPLSGPLIEQNSKSAAYTTVLSDNGKHILHPAADTTARTFTIDSNANVPYPIGAAITFVNENGAGVVTISITSDTMRLAGAGTTGSRTLAANGMATALKVTSTSWMISGTGLT